MQHLKWDMWMLRPEYDLQSQLFVQFIFIYKPIIWIFHVNLRQRPLVGLLHYWLKADAGRVQYNSVSPLRSLQHPWLNTLPPLWVSESPVKTQQYQPAVRLQTDNLTNTNISQTFCENAQKKDPIVVLLLNKNNSWLRCCFQKEKRKQQQIILCVLMHVNCALWQSMADISVGHLTVGHLNTAWKWLWIRGKSWWFVPWRERAERWQCSAVAENRELVCAISLAPLA